jgi:RNA recognition motif-containing protein
LETRLFVDNLPPGMSEEALQAMFAGNGCQVLRVSIMTDRRTGQSHGYGFVEMASAADTERAIHALHGLVVRGQSLHVSKARPRVQR